MEGRVANVVLLEQLRNEDHFSKHCFKDVLRVVLGANMENGLVLVVSELEVLLSLREDFLQRLNVIVLEGVVQGQVPVVIRCVWSGLNFINDARLL